MFRDMKRYGLNPEEITKTKTWGKPKQWNKEAEAEKKPCLVFTCSWSDFFIEQADPWREEAWKIIKSTPWLQWQILTKRIKRVKKHLPEDWGEGYPNVWLGTSIESSTYNWRADVLSEVPAKTRFISAEPLLASLVKSDKHNAINLKGIHWLIAGGESGDEHRPMEIDWVKELRDLCVANKTAFYYKQESGFLPSKNPPLLDGRTWEEYPEIWQPEE
jgi:protein gp37